MNVTITRVNDAKAHVQAPYELRDICKGIPTRVWHKTLKVWTIDAAYIEDARRLFEEDGHRVHIIGTRQPTPADWATALFASVPTGLHDKTYRALARVLHPDAGGDTRSAQQLNDAFSRRHP